MRCLIVLLPSSTARAQPSLTPPVLRMRALLCLLAASTAYAEPPQTETIERSYRYQGVLADVGAASVVGAGVAANEPSVIYAGIAAYALGAPLVHGCHGEAGWAGISFGLRVSLPLTMAGLFAVLGHTDTGDEGVDNKNLASLAVGGLVLGSITAIVIDDAALPHATKIVRLRVQPTVSQPRGGVVLGIKGHF